MKFPKTINHEVNAQVQALVYASCLRTNAGDWPGFLDLCEQGDFRYRITNFSPEIKREQCWMFQDFPGLKKMFELLPKHNSDHSGLTRHAVVHAIEFDEEKLEAKCTSVVTIYRTQLDGASSHFESGKTSLYAIGQYLDVVRFGDDGPRLAERIVRLETRQLDIGTHYPL